MESQNARLEVYRKGLDGDQQRLQLALAEKDAEIKVRMKTIIVYVRCCFIMKFIIFQSLRSKCEALTRGVSKLEDKCTHLSTTVDTLNNQLERSAVNEGDLQVSSIIRSTLDKIILNRIKCWRIEIRAWEI